MAGHECSGGEQHFQLRSAGEHGHSINTPTLEEVQRRLGAPLHGMNLDVLLNLVAIAHAAGAASAGTVVPPALSEKAVVELWRDVQLGNSKTGTDTTALGEMTLEEFLQKAAEKQRLQCSRRRRRESVVEAFADTSSMRRPPYGSTGARADEPRMRGGQRVAVENTAELIVERRLKRMIKNRESAARSRARRQAYTNELENKIIRLEEENRRLRKREELETIVDSVPQPDPKHHHHLRRTSSATF